MAGSTYSPTASATKAVNQLSASLKDKNGRGMFSNDLDAYLSTLLRDDYSTKIGLNKNDLYGSALNKMNAQSDAAWALSRQQQIEAMNAAEAQNYANTQNAIAQMRNALAGSASSGANRGAANATALQALLGLGQQNSQATTQGMQSYQDTSKEAAAARAANAVNALDLSRETMNSMYNNATSAYGADHTYGMQGIAEAYGNVAAGADTNASSERMNTATNATNEKVAATTQKSESKQTIINKK